jgi:hypothetical protein
MAVNDSNDPDKNLLVSVKNAASTQKTDTTLS